MAAHGICNPTIMYVKVENRKDYKTLLNKGVGLKGKSGNPNETLLIQKGEIFDAMLKKDDIKSLLLQGKTPDEIKEILGGNK